jgi:hypothetical protein
MTATKANVGSLVASATTVVLYILARLTGVVALPDATLLQDAIVTIVTAVVTYGATWVSVYFSRNTVKMLNPLALLASLGLALLMLGGCSALGSQPVKNIQGNIDTAQTYVDTGFNIVGVCIAAHLPICSSPSFASGVAQARTVVDEAMQQARDLAASDPTQAQTLLRVAMNAVLLFYSLK